MLEVPVGTASKQAITVNLDGVAPTRLGLRWNTTTERWHLSVAQADGTVVLSGVRVVVVYPLLDGYSHIDGLPTGGKLMCIAEGAPFVDPGRDSLGTSHHLVWITDAELAAIT